MTNEEIVNDDEDIEGVYEIIEPKQGYKTTEFWITAACQIFGLLSVAGIFTEVQSEVLSASIEKIVGGFIMGASAFGYSISRGNAKKLY